MIEGITVIDFHSHANAIETMGARNDPASMLRAMDATGIDAACVFNCTLVSGMPGNQVVADWAARYPGRFIGFAYVSPVMAESISEELTRCFDVLKLRGIKLLPHRTRWPLNDPVWYPIYAFANARGVPVIFHTDEMEEMCPPRYLADVAPQFPNATFVAGHSGNTAGGRAETIAAARACPNVYSETCSTYRTPGAIEELVSGCGAERVLFGSDQPLMDPRAQIGKIITADISDEAKRLILGANARRLLRL